MRNFHERYWVAVIPHYYPAGFLDDIEFTSNDESKAIEFAKIQTKHSEITENREDILIWDDIAKKYISFV
jgi:hypothetical protein